MSFLKDPLKAAGGEEVDDAVAGFDSMVFNTPSHQIAVQKEKQLEAMRDALVLGEVKEGEAFDMGEDSAFPVEVTDDVPDMDEEVTLPYELLDEAPSEDQEEGELSEKEEMIEDGKAAEEISEVNTEAVPIEGKTEVPLLKKRASLDDLAGRAVTGSRIREEFAKRDGREGLGRDDEENPWLRDKVAFRPAATSYAPNLYNFAWAQAVQGRPGFKLVEAPAVKEDDIDADELQGLDASFEEDETEEWQGELPEVMEDMSLGIPEGYDMRQRLYDRRLMRSASWNASRGEPRRERNWVEAEEDLEVRRRFGRDEREGSRVVVISRREGRGLPSRRRDGRVSSRRDDPEGDAERERGSERERERRSIRDRLREGERPRVRENDRERDRGRERADRKETLQRPTSSDESLHSRGSAPTASKGGRKSQSDDNSAEVREEGEIEEGEIELPNQMPGSRSPSREKSNDLPEDNDLNEERLPNQNAKRSLASRLSFKRQPSHSRSLSRDSSFVRLQDDDLRHRLTRDAEREKSREESRLREERREQIAQVGSLVKNVTVKDAQKSFLSTCRRLDNAMRLLEDLAKQRNSSTGAHLDGLPHDVSKLTTKVFQGLRAVYAVWNTASGREQERDKDTFPRLLELVNGSYLKLFTSKQARELREFMGQVTKAARKSDMEGFVQQLRVAPKSAELLQDSKVRHRKPSDNTASSTSLTRSTLIAGTAMVLETPEHRPENFTDTKHAIDEAAIAAAALAYAQSSAAAFANLSQGSTYSRPPDVHPTSEQSYWGWNGSNDSFEQSMSPGLPPGYSGGSHTARVSIAPGLPGQSNGFINSQAGTLMPSNPSNTGWMVQPMENGNKKVSHNAKAPYGPGFLEEHWEELSPPHATTAGYTTTIRKIVKLNERGFPISTSETATINLSRSKTVNTAMSASFQLPSPTPSEEDDDQENYPVEPPPLAVGEKPSFSLGPKTLFPLSKPTITVPPVARPFYTTLNTHVDESGRVHYASVPVALPPPPVDQDRALNFEQPKSQPDSGSVSASLRSRDPRRQLQNGLVNDIRPQPGAHFKHPWPTAAQAASLSTSRKREGEDLSLVDPLKRLKMSGSNNGMLVSEPSVGAFAMGGWLEDSATMSSSQENYGTQAMDIDLESPTDADRNCHMNADVAGASSRSSEAQRANVISEMVGPGTTGRSKENQIRDSFSNLSSKLEEQAAEEAGDAGKHRMRPRDPRRFLLETPAEKADVMPMSGSSRENLVPGAAPQPRKRSPSPANPKPSLYEQPSTKTSGYAQNQTEGPSNPTGMRSNSVSTSTPNAQSATESRNMPSYPLAEDINCSEKSKEGGKGGDSKLAKECPGVVSVESTTGVDDDEDLGPLDPSSRKPRFGPSHWGGSEVHPDLEQLLGGLAEVERLAIQKERKRRMEEQDRMFSAGKLCLVLDLDHTLLNSAKFVEIEPEWETRLRAAESAERSRANREGNTKRELYRFPHMGMWTKLRPGIWNFLAKASELYELHVYTMGNKAYATEMAKLLDPTGSLFAGRVISKGDEADPSDSDDRPPKSKDLDGVLGMESAVVIIDDSSRVWPHHRENLIVVERYMYFPCSRRQFGLPGPSLLEVGHDERSADGMLSSSLAVIDRIHENFFSNRRLREVDVRAILASEQRRVLTGCCILFSRIFPVGEANPHMHPLWRMAEQFGASCCLNINDKVTHVVAISLGTDKVNWASATGRPVVRPAWLEASAILYRRANEQDFPVPP